MMADTNLNEMPADITRMVQIEAYSQPDEPVVIDLEAK